MHEYKVVPAPLRVVRVRGLKTTPERFAHQLTGALNAVAAEGWEYLRTETLPCEERKGLFGVRTTTQSVMIFRRPLPAGAARAELRPAIPPAPPAPGTLPPETLPPEVAPLRRAPVTPFSAVPASAQPDAAARKPDAPRRAEPVFRPGALSRGPDERPYPPLRGVAPEGGTDDPDDRQGGR